MGSSNKKKKEKAKDFQKPKLKVGKSKAKANNHTDTSFRSKAIVLHQRITGDASESANGRFKHQLSLITSRSDTQRKDALIFLTGQLSTTPATNPLGTTDLLMRLLPLMSDSSAPVRSQLLKLLKSLPAPEVKPEVEKIVRRIRMAMTDISQGVKDDGLNYMDWLLDIAGEDLVSKPSCWVKPLKDFMAILGWSGIPIKDVKANTGRNGVAVMKDAKKSGWTSAPRTTFGAKNHGQSFPQQMTILARFLECGFRAHAPIPWGPEQWLESFTRMPTEQNPYGFLDLFGPPRDEDGEMYRDREDRQYIFRKLFQEQIQIGIDAAKKEGGAAGRAAATLDKVVADGMVDFETAASRNDDDEGLWGAYIM